MYRTFVDIKKEEIVKILVTPKSFASILHELGCIDNTYNRNKLKEFILINNLSIDNIKSNLTKDTYINNPKHCKHCGEIIPYEKRQNDFCSHSCAASFNNKGICKHGVQRPEHSYCLNCGEEITRGTKFCNNTCAGEYKEKKYIDRWLNGEESGICGKDDIREPIKHYLFKIHNNSCEKCGWHKVSEFTGKVPLQIHHIDGDCRNNSPENLELLCPNCHALTENFGSRNKNCTRLDKRSR